MQAIISTLQCQTACWHPTHSVMSFSGWRRGKTCVSIILPHLGGHGTRSLLGSREGDITAAAAGAATALTTQASSSIAHNKKHTGICSIGQEGAQDSVDQAT